MYLYNSSPIQEINTDWLRRNLRFVLNEVNHGARYAVLRRGSPVAGIVPATEARALCEATNPDLKYREIQEDLDRRERARLREAVAEMRYKEKEQPWHRG